MYVDFRRCLANYIPYFLVSCFAKYFLSMIIISGEKILMRVSTTKGGGGQVTPHRRGPNGVGGGQGSNVG